MRWWVVGVEFVVVEAVVGAAGLGGGGWDDGAFVDTAGEVVGLAGGAGAEDSLECGGRGVGDGADGGDAVAGERAGGPGADAGQGRGRFRAQECGDLVRVVPDHRGGAGRGGGCGHGRDPACGTGAGRALDTVERQQSEAEQVDDAFDVAVPESQGSGEVGVGGPVGGQGLDAGADAFKDCEELSVQAVGPLCGMKVDPQDRAWRGGVVFVVIRRSPGSCGRGG